MPDWLPHPDGVVGALSSVAHALRPRARNTMEALRSYEGMDVEALFGVVCHYSAHHYAALR